jgi:bile acid acyltransferase/acyl-CoA thioester hydrolase-like protein/acyl-CoA thioester hydrolase/bile acid acetyltransferase-like protein
MTSAKKPMPTYPLHNIRDSLEVTRHIVALLSTLAWLCLVSVVSAAASISATPEAALLDQRLSIQIVGLKPNVPVRLSAKSLAQDALWWRSEAVFTADDRGQIDLDHQAPQSGSYGGIDGMGLFWAMHPDKEPKRADHLSFAIEDFSRPVTTIIEVADAAGAITSASIERRYAPVGVRSISVHSGVVATLYKCAHSASLPGVLVIGGSDGGPGAPGVAMLLASHGFAAASLSYFGVAGLPATLENVPMEYFQKALQWMRSQPDIDPRSIAIYSESRGTEAALFTAASDPGVSAVVARSPSFTYWSGVTAAHLPGKAAWTFQGEPLPYIANTLYSDFILTYLWDKVTNTSVRQTPLFLEDLARSTDRGKIAIPVEQIHGAVMLLAGADDQIWPSTMMAERIMARLLLHGHAYRDQSVTFPAVGHPIPYAYLPTRGNWQDAPFAVGGTPEGMAKAQANAWPQILKFLSEEADRARSGGGNGAAQF